ncbi:MAG: hypothetical protein ACK4S3_06135 [Parvibaculum sp.]
MARAGRKRKSGARTKSGRLSRAGVTPYDHGTERAQAMRALYGDNWSDPIGRAFEAKLLGEGSNAKAMLDLARSLHVAYWRAYMVGPIRCTLGASDGKQTGDVIDFDAERTRRRETWLRESLSFVAGMGVRRQFDQLVLDVNPDHGPDWLDRIIYDEKRGKATATASDHGKLRAALDALETLAGC